MSKTIPALPVRDIEQAVDFYRDRFGFNVVHREQGFAVVVRDEAEIHLWAANDGSWEARPDLPGAPVKTGAESFLAGTASCRVQVDGIEELFAEYKEAGVLYDQNTQVVQQ